MRARAGSRRRSADRTPARARGGSTPPGSPRRPASSRTAPGRRRASPLRPVPSSRRRSRRRGSAASSRAGPCRRTSTRAARRAWRSRRAQSLSRGGAASSGEVAGAVAVRMEGERVHDRLLPPARAIRGSEVADESRRGVGVSAGACRPVGAARGECAAVDTDVGRDRLERVVGLGEEHQVRARGLVRAVERRTAAARSGRAFGSLPTITSRKPGTALHDRGCVLDELFSGLSAQSASSFEPAL